MSGDAYIEYLAQTSYGLTKAMTLNKLFNGVFTNLNEKFIGDKSKYRKYSDFQKVLESAKNTEIVNLLVKEQDIDTKTMLYVVKDEKGNLILCDAGYYSRSGTFIFCAYSEDLEVSKAYLKEICSNIETPPDKDDNDIGVKFWSYNSQMGKGSYTERSIESNEWESIKENYADATQKELDDFIKDFENKEAKLAIFSGPPGTGKTTVIRAIFNEWKETCECNYILDPPDFFNGTPRYMMDLILGRDLNSFIDPFEENFLSEEELKPKKMILVFEDCGELIGKTAKADVGAGLSKFLNMVDGMIGHGLNIGVILTTNEEITEFHEAVARPGRVSAIIKFEKFSIEETKVWFKTKGLEISSELESEIKKESGFSVAECYDKLKSEKAQLKKPKGKSKAKKVGFGS